jgi:PAS domain S-box-containing protein
MSRKVSGTIRHSREKGKKDLPGEKSSPSPLNESHRKAENSLPAKTPGAGKPPKMRSADTRRLVRGPRIHISEHSRTEEAPRESEAKYREIADELAKANKELQKKIAAVNHAKAVLAAQSGLLEAFFKHTLTPLVFLDKAFNFIRVNEAYARACGRDVSEFPEHNHFEFYPDKENEMIFGRVVETKIPYTAIAKPFVFPDRPEMGVTYWDWTIFPLLDDEGEVDFLVFSLEDVTSSITAERLLRKTKEKFQNTLESISDGFFTLDKEWRFTYLNREAVRLWNLPYDDLIGKSMWDVSPKEIGTIFDRQYHRAVNEKVPVSFEALFPVHNIWLEVRAYPSEDGLSVYFLDIDKKKQGETRVKATNDLLKLFSGASSRKDYLDSVAKLIRSWTGCCCVGVGILDKEGNIPYESNTGFNGGSEGSEDLISMKDIQFDCLSIMLGEEKTHRLSDMTPFGSFRSDNTFELVETLSEADRSRFRDLCMRTGFRSMAIIPVRHKDSVVGAIHLADKQGGMVPLERVEFIESISTLLGEAIHRFNLDEEMHENFFNQAAINMVLSTSLEDIPLDMFLKKTLTIILSVPWLTSESGGCIHIIEDNPDILVRRARHNLPEALRESCDNVPLGRCICGRAALTQQTQFADHVNKQHDIWGEGMSPHGHYAVPIVFGGRTLGVINIYLCEWHVRDRKEEVFLETIANTLAGIIVRRQSEDLLKKSQEYLSDSREKLRHLNAYLQSVREKERTEIAREIHDEFGTILTALKIDLSWIEKKLPQEQRLLTEKTRNGLDLINAAIKAVQRISSELRPGILDHLGLASAVEWHVKEFGLRTGIACDISVEMDNAELDRDLSTTIFRILQEALTNIARHSEATEVTVELKKEEGMLSLIVADNGKGIMEEQLSAHDSFGLMGIKERVKHWSGDLTIRGSRNEGTTIAVNIPLENKEGNR